MMTLHIETDGGTTWRSMILEGIPWSHEIILYTHNTTEYVPRCVTVYKWKSLYKQYRFMRDDQIHTLLRLKTMFIENAPSLVPARLEDISVVALDRSVGRIIRMDEYGIDLDVKNIDTLASILEHWRGHGFGDVYVALLCVQSKSGILPGKPVLCWKEQGGELQPFDI